MNYFISMVSICDVSGGKGVIVNISTNCKAEIRRSVKVDGIARGQSRDSIFNHHHVFTTKD